MPPLTGSTFCFAHDPEAAEARARARSEGGRNAHLPYQYSVYDASEAAIEAMRAVYEEEAELYAPLIAEREELDRLLIAEREELDRLLLADLP
jgi:hypothetical protein